MWLRLIACGALLTAPYQALAEPTAPPTINNERYLSISVENDLFGGGTDRYYTSGVRATWFDAETQVPKGVQALAKHIPTFTLDDSTGTSFTLGHNMYTPEDITIRGQQNNDRPWAAFLYASVGLANITDNNNKPFHIDEIELTLGVVGPEALGEPIQEFVHEYISNSPEPQGWDNQLKFEPGIMISWQRRIPYALSYDYKYFNARVEPNFSITLGNIRSHAGMGATFILGSSKQQDTPQRVRPAIPGTGVFFSDDNEVDWQIFAGIDGRLVGRDIFLDGNTFSDSHSIDKKHLVGDLSTGVSLSYDDYRLSYTLNMRTKEFDGQEDESIFGSLTLTKRF